MEILYNCLMWLRLVLISILVNIFDHLEHNFIFHLQVFVCIQINSRFRYYLCVLLHILSGFSHALKLLSRRHVSHTRASTFAPTLYRFLSVPKPSRSIIIDLNLWQSDTLHLFFLLFRQRVNFFDVLGPFYHTFLISFKRINRVNKDLVLPECTLILPRLLRSLLIT